jgi:chromosome segregation ATPase
MTGLLGSLALALALAGQDPTHQPETLMPQAIVEELRLLREAVEQVLSTSVRVQLLMGRLQLQEARIQALVRQGAEIDSQLAGMEAERQSLANQRRMLEKVPERSTDPTERDFAVQQLASLADRLKQIDNRHNSLLAEQASVQQLVGTEQTRWGDFNSRLEELERLLASSKR